MEGCARYSSGIKQESFLHELGADQSIKYAKIPPEDVAQDLDLVLDTLGGPTTGRFLRTLKRGGALFPVFPGFSDAKEAAKLGVTVLFSRNRPQLAPVVGLIE